MAILPYGRQLIEDDDIEAVVTQLRDPWLTQGPTIGRFEDELTRITGAKYAVAVSSGTAALHLACLAVGCTSADHGVTATNTFVASANGMRYCGTTPVMVDVDPATGLISLERLESTLDAMKRDGKPVKVVIPVDFAGAPAHLPQVQALAAAHGARVIEDAAHSLGAEYVHEGKTFRAASCAHADMAILSFHPVKHLTTGEGGAITTNDEKLYRRMLDLRTHGITRDPERLVANDGPWYQEQQSLGFNYRLTDIQAALGISQAAKFDRFIARRREIAAQYDAAFAKAPFSGKVIPLTVPEGVKSAYHLYVIRLAARSGETLSSTAERRKATYMALREAEILPQVHYVPVHRHPDFASFVAGQSFPGCDAYYASCMSLPMFPAMTDADVARVEGALSRIEAATA